MRKGFTLVELLVVVVIIVVLAGLLWGPFTRARQRKQEMAAAQWEVGEPFLYGRVLDTPRPVAYGSRKYVGHMFVSLAIPYQSGDGSTQILLIPPPLSDYGSICFTDEDGDGLDDLPQRGDELWEVRITKEGVAYEATVLSSAKGRAIDKAYEVALDLNQKKK